MANTTRRLWWTFRDGHPSQSLPVPKEHNLDNSIGQTTSISITANGIDVEGQIDDSTLDGELAVAAGRGGLKWEASIGASVQQMEFFNPGETVNVNGRDFRGPVYVARKTRLQEVSLVRRGADRNATHVSIAAKLNTEEESSMSIEATLKAERDRVAAIHQTARDYPSICARAISEGWSVDATNTALVAEIRASREVAPGYVADRGGPLTHRHLTAGMLCQLGLEKVAVEKFGAGVVQAARDRKFDRMAYAELLQASAAIDGKEAPSLTEIKASAFSTTSMSTALGTTMNMQLTTAYNSAPSPWRSFAGVKTANDFKTQTGVRPIWASSTLEKVAPTGEIKHAAGKEETYTWSVDTYAKMLTITRRDLINDSLGAFADILPGMGRAAARSLNDLVATTMLANASNFWHSSNSNYFSGAGSALGTAGLAQAIKGLRAMKDGDSNLIDLQPSVLLVPSDLEQTARALLNSDYVERDVSSVDNLPTGNTHKGVASLVVDPRLGDSTFTGYSATAWYLFAQNDLPSVVVAFLNGNQTPMVETFDTEPHTLGTVHRIVFDYGVALVDGRCSIKNAGA